MNANEQLEKMTALQLADELDWMTPEKLVCWCDCVQTMLRQQQAVIEAGKIMIKGYGKAIDEQQAEIKALKAHPLKDREADRLRFSDEAFNRWLDESISDSGHTVYDLVENVCDAWHGWENSQHYTHPVKELTDEEMEALEYLIEQYGNCRFMEGNTGMNLSEMSDEILERFKSILRKAIEK